MVQLGNNDSVEFLVHRKFPGAATIWFPTSRRVVTPAERAAHAALLKESAEYRTTLKAMPEAELEALFISETKRRLRS
jgi:hypothetical protein